VRRKYETVTKERYEENWNGLMRSENSSGQGTRQPKGVNSTRLVVQRCPVTSPEQTTGRRAPVAKLQRMWDSAEDIPTHPHPAITNNCCTSKEQL